MSASGESVSVRELRAADLEAWLLMRERLWPDFSREHLTVTERELFPARDRECAWVAELAPDGLVGFVEASIRDRANECESGPVGYIEGWYVEPQYRRVGIGRRLVAAAEQWAAALGCREMGSDTHVENKPSRCAHRAMGYREAVIVAFAKRLCG